MISRDEWLSALNEARTSDPNALTVNELAELLGVSRSSAHVRIAALLKSGKARRTVKLIAIVSGGTRPVPAYILLKGKTK